jgi:arylsulfatase A-like enzyme
MRQGVQAVIEPWTRWGLPLTERTLPQALREAGYRTALVGKWHLGAHARAYLPLARGFDHHYGPYHGALDDQFTRTRMGGLDWHRNGEPVWEEGYSTDLLAAEAVRLVAEHDPRQPLFLMVSFTVPHQPLQATPDCQARAPVSHYPPRTLIAGMMVCMDDAIGRIVSAFRQRGMWKNTFFLFTNDNGAWPSSGALNAPLRDGKGTLYEGGIRVPAIVSWPRKLAGGWRYGHLLHAVDVYATVIDVARASARQPLAIDGRSFWRGLRRKVPVRRELLHYLGPGGAALRYGPWKLISRPQKTELYHVAKDPGELLDLAPYLPWHTAWLSQRIATYAPGAAPPFRGSSRPPPGFVVPAVWEPTE